MMLWALFAVMTAAVVLVLLRPLARSTDGSADGLADVAVYKDQLAEIDADAARGLIQPADAEVARREIARRLLAAAPPASNPPSQNPPAPAVGQTGRTRPMRPYALGLAVGVPVAAIGLYALLGSPAVPSMPFAARQTAPIEAAPVADLIAKVEARLGQNPNDGQGWDVIAPVYFRLQRYADAAQAYGRAAALLGETTPRLAGFAEATVLANDGVVTESARLAYEKILASDPTRIEPKFWLALAIEQDGRRTEAAAAYRALLAQAPPSANWRALVEERLAAVTGTDTPTGNAPKQPPATAQPATAQQAPRGPSAADVSAASKMSDGDRAQMIRGMVDGLAKRLADNPSDVQGWLRLVQSYAVLGERERAAAALADARRKLAGNTAALGELTALAKSLGLGT